MTKISNQYSLTNILTADLANSRLGINNVSPTVALDVTGAGKFSNTVTVVAPASSTALALLGRSTDNYSALRFQSNTGATTYSTIYSDASNLIFENNGSERLKISSNGDLNLTSGVAILNRSGKKIELNPNSALTNTTAEIEITSGMDLFFKLGGSERMRITSGGDALFGTTTSSGNATGGSTNVGVIVEGANGAVTTQRNNNANIFLSKASGFTEGILINFFAIGTSRGSISTNGLTTSFNSTSDYRLKEDLKPINGLNILNKINVYNYKWKESDERMDGVLAHELAEVLPYAVYGIKDGEKMQAVDYSKIVPILIKSIQEQEVQIQELSAEITILKNK